MLTRTVLALLLMSLGAVGALGQPDSALPIEFAPQTAHTQQVTALTYSPDGRFLASASTDDTIRIWDANDRALLRTIGIGGGNDATSHEIKILAFTADNLNLFALADDGIRLWRTETGKLFAARKDFLFGAARQSPLLGYNRMEIARNGTALLVSNQEGVRLLDPASLKDISDLRDDRRIAIGPARITPDGKTVVASQRCLTTEGCNPDVKGRWNFDTGMFAGEQGAAFDELYSLDGRLTASLILGRGGSIENSIVVRSNETVVCTFGGAAEPLFPIFDIAFGADSTKLYISVDRSRRDDYPNERQIGVWTETGGCKIDWSVVEEVDKSVVRPGAGGLTIARRGSGELRTLEDLREPSKPFFEPIGDALSALLLAANADRAVRVFRPIDQEKFGLGFKHRSEKVVVSNTFRIGPAKSFWREGERFQSSALSPDGKLLAVTVDDAVQAIPLDDPAATRTIIEFPRIRHSAPFSIGEQLTFSPNGSLYAPAHGADHETDVLRWDPQQPEAVASLERSAECGAPTFSRNGALILMSCPDGLSLWDQRSGKRIVTLKGSIGQHRNDIASRSFALSPDGRIAVALSARDRDGSGTQAFSAQLWETATGQPSAVQGELRNFTFEDTHVKFTFSPNGQTLLCIDAKGTMNIFDAMHGSLLRVIASASHPDDQATFTSDGTYLITANDQGRVRVWDAQGLASSAKDQKALLLVSYFARPLTEGNAQWLAMTPDGFFGSSYSIGVPLRVVRGLRQTAIEQVHQSLYNPDLVREALAGDQNHEVADAAKVVNLDKVLASGPAPVVTISSPATGTRSSVDEIDITARIKDLGKGVGRVEWRVNGVTAAVLPSPDAVRAEHTLTRSISLDPGENLIEVVAYNEKNLLASRPSRATVIYTGPADQADQPDRDPRPKPRLHVLAIGVDQYADPGVEDYPGFGKLSLAVADAKALADEFKRAAVGYYAGEPNIIPLNDADATREGIAAAFARLEKVVQPRDTFILFAAGHGVTRYGRFYLIPHGYEGGAHAGMLRQHAISQESLQDWLANKIRAKHALVLLDTCESGGVVAGHLRSRVDGAASEAGLGRLHEATGRPVLTAAALDQSAVAGTIRDGDRHGIFTWAVLDALHHADVDEKGNIRLSALVAHVQKVVPEIAAEKQSKSAPGQEKRGAAIEFRGAGTDLAARRLQSPRFGSHGEDFVIAIRVE